MHYQPDVVQGQAHPLLPAELVPNLLLAFAKPDAHRSMLHEKKASMVAARHLWLHVAVGFLIQAALHNHFDLHPMHIEIGQEGRGAPLPSREDLPERGSCAPQLDTHKRPQMYYTRT